MRRYWVLVLGFLALVAAGYFAVSTFILPSRARTLAADRVATCASRFPGVRPAKILADGQVWLVFEPTTDESGVRECLGLAAKEQSRRMRIFKAPEEIPATIAVLGLPVKPDMTFGDLGTLIAAAVAAVAGTLALFQLQVMSRQARVDVLLRIDDRWEADAYTMGQVRDRISRFYSDAVALAQTAWPAIDETERQRLIETELFPWLLADLRVNRPRRYQVLCQALGFFETVGHAVEKGYLSVSEVTNLLGPSIRQMDFVFGGHLRQLQTANPHLYENVSKLTQRVATHRRWQGRMRSVGDWLKLMPLRE